MTTITPELKTFMNNLWGAEGEMIDTPLGEGRIENVRTKAGIDLEVMVKIPDTDGLTKKEFFLALFNGMELFDMEAGRP